MNRLANNKVVHAATAEDADALAGQAPSAYQTVVAYQGHGFLTDPLGPLASGA